MSVVRCPLSVVRCLGGAVGFVRHALSSVVRRPGGSVGFVRHGVGSSVVRARRSGGPVGPGGGVGFVRRGRQDFHLARGGVGAPAHTRGRWLRSSRSRCRPSRRGAGPAWPRGPRRRPWRGRLAALPLSRVPAVAVAPASPSRRRCLSAASTRMRPRSHVASYRRSRSPSSLPSNNSAGSTVSSRSRCCSSTSSSRSSSSAIDLQQLRLARLPDPPAAAPSPRGRRAARRTASARPAAAR